MLPIEIQELILLDTDFETVNAFYSNEKDANRLRNRFIKKHYFSHFKNNIELLVNDSKLEIGYTSYSTSDDSSNSTDGSSNTFDGKIQFDDNNSDSVTISLGYTRNEFFQIPTLDHSLYKDFELILEYDNNQPPDLPTCSFSMMIGGIVYYSFAPSDFHFDYIKTCSYYGLCRNIRHENNMLVLPIPLVTGKQGIFHPCFHAFNVEFLDNPGIKASLRASICPNSIRLESVYTSITSKYCATFPHFVLLPLLFEKINVILKFENYSVNTEFTLEFITTLNQKMNIQLQHHLVLPLYDDFLSEKHTSGKLLTIDIDGKNYEWYLGGCCLQFIKFGSGFCNFAYHF